MALFFFPTSTEPFLWSFWGGRGFESGRGCDFFFFLFIFFAWGEIASQIHPTTNKWYSAKEV